MIDTIENTLIKSIVDKNNASHYFFRIKGRPKLVKHAVAYFIRYKGGANLYGKKLAGPIFYTEKGVAYLLAPLAVKRLDDTFYTKAKKALISDEPALSSIQSSIELLLLFVRAQ